LTALSERVRSSFLGRCVLRFVLIQGFDRCIVISAQTFTALIPLFIVVASAAPAGQEDVISQAIIERFALSGESAAAVEQLFTTPPDATSEATVFSVLLLFFSGVAFTRALARMYRAAWGQEKAGIRSALFASLGLAALILEVIVAYWIRAFLSRFPLEWLWAIPLSAAIGFVLWTSIPYLLLDRQVHWRRLLAAGLTSSLGMTLLAVATPIYIPQLMTRATTEFGLFGITITIIGWLLVAAGILVVAAVIGAEFDATVTPWLVGVKKKLALVDPGREVEEVTVEDRQGLTSADLLALVRVLINWLIMAGAVWIATAVVPGIDVNGGLATYLFVSLLFGMINALLGPVLSWLAGSQSWLRLGGSALLVNGILFALTAGLSPNLNIAGLGSAVLGALVVAVAGTLLELVVRPVPPP
jgi:membrane protein